MQNGKRSAREILAQHGFSKVVFRRNRNVPRRLRWCVKVGDAFPTSPVGDRHFGGTPLSAAINVLGARPLTKEAWNNHPGPIRPAQAVGSC